MNVVTPIEPPPPQGSRPADGAGEAQVLLQPESAERLTVAAASECGTMHSTNEDSHSPLGCSSRLFVVADGVGGGALASMASRELVGQLHATLAQGPLDAAAVRRAIIDADGQVQRRAARETDAPAAATLALCARVSASAWLLAWVGDCRIYRIGTSADQPAQLLTRDDTYRELGEQAPAGGSPDDPARMVGNGAVGHPHVQSAQLEPGEVLVLCSDGVHKHIEAGDFSRALRSGLPLAQACGKLVALARQRGSRDDATVLVVRRDRTAAGRGLGLAGLALVLAAGFAWAFGPWRQDTEVQELPALSHSAPHAGEAAEAAQAPASTPTATATPATAAPPTRIATPPPSAAASTPATTASATAAAANRASASEPAARKSAQ